MEYLIFIVLYIFIFGMYMLYFLINKKSKKKMIEVNYLEKKHKIKFKEKDMKSLKLYIALINSFIFVSTGFIMQYINNIFYKFLIAFVLIMFLIIILYKLLSLKYKKNNRK